MVDPGVLAFARGVLPAPPARILEIGAGDGELAAALREGGHEVTAIDPKAQDGDAASRRTALIDATRAPTTPRSRSSRCTTWSRSRSPAPASPS